MTDVQSGIQSLKGFIRKFDYSQMVDPIQLRNMSDAELKEYEKFLFTEMGMKFGADLVEEDTVVSRTEEDTKWGGIKYRIEAYMITDVRAFGLALEEMIKEAFMNGSRSATVDIAKIISRAAVREEAVSEEPTVEESQE